MKKKLQFLFLTLVGMMCSGSAWAQFDDGEYLLKNVESGGFLQGDSYWGTKAVTGEIPYLVTLTRISDGVYTIKSQQNNGKDNGKDKQYVTSGEDPYMDGVSCNMTFTAAGDYYTINNGTGNLYIVPTSLDNANVNLVKAGDVTDNTAKWQVISKASVIEEINNATAANPVNATIFIKDAGFDSKSVSSSSWTNLGTQGGGNAGHCIESWNTESFDTYQTITGLPNGKYKVTCRGFYRWNSASGNNDNSAAIEAHSNGTEVLNAKLYAGDKSVDLMSVANYEGTLEALPYSATDCTAQWKAAANFTTGFYLNEITDVLVTDGTLKIGVKKDTKAGTDWTVFDNFQLYYYGVDLTALRENLATRIDVAKAITGKMNTIVAANLADTIYAAENCAETKDALEMAISQLNSMITKANASIAAYTSIAAINTKAAALDAAGQASYASTLAAYNDGTLTTADEAETAYLTAVKSQTTDGADMTDAIINPSFETGNYDGWTTTESGDTGAKLNSNATYTMTPCDGNYVFNTWSVGTAITQTVAGLPAGVYTLSCYMATDANHTFSLTGNGVEGTAASIDKGTAVTVTVDDITVTDGNLVISAGTTDNYWYKADNFKLTFKNVISLTDYYDAIAAALATANDLASKKMNADVAQSLTNAINAADGYNLKTNVSELTTISSDLTNANAAAQTSVTKYADAAVALSAQKALIDGTNVYEEAGWTTYTDNYNTLKGKYDNNTLTNDEVVVNPATATGWHASTGYNFLLTPWTIGGEACNNFDKDLYINTWSVEGASDGTNFTVPFFEYWTGDANSLIGNNLAATVSGLEEGSYDVTAWVRVRLNNGSKDQTATGITFQANDGAAVDACAGEQVGESQFRIMNVTATGYVGEDGILSIKFNVGADNNISWLSFKNVKYTKGVGSATMNIDATNKWATFYAPFEVDVPANVYSYAITVDGSNNAVRSKIGGGVAYTLPAETPVLVYCDSVGGFYQTFTEGAATGTPEAKPAKNYLVGTAVAINVPASTAEHTNYVLQNPSVLGWYSVNNNTLPANRAYLSVPASTDVKGIFDFDETTGIADADVVPEHVEGDGKTYNLAGQAVGKDYKGIVIVNGKKMLNK